MFEIENVLVTKIELLTKQKLFSSCKLNLEEKSAGGANENTSLKDDLNFIVAPFVFANQKCLLLTGNPKRRNIEVFLSDLLYI